jgi:catechol 2,3-dioxygenase-like lactoylglutathione lyase family enzyme
MAGSSLALIEFPADDADRARRFWGRLLGVGFESRTAAEGGLRVADMVEFLGRAGPHTHDDGRPSLEERPSVQLEG